MRHRKHSFFGILKDLKPAIENKGTKLVITFEGDKEQIADLEKKLQAIHTLHEAFGDDCCHGEGCC